MNIVALKENWYKAIDKEASKQALQLSQGELITEDTLLFIHFLYQSMQIEQQSFTDDNFESAYHPPITPDFEFLLARLFYHYGKIMGLQWKVLLRRQKQRSAPDIVVQNNQKTIAIIEIKAKAGWIQSQFSKNITDKFEATYNEGSSDFDPNAFNNRVKKQFEKYCQTYDTNLDQIYLLLPSLNEVHRKRSKQQVADYRHHFCGISGIPESNFILLSNNLKLNLSRSPLKESLIPTDQLEHLFWSLEATRIQSY